MSDETTNEQRPATNPLREFAPGVDPSDPKTQAKVARFKQTLHNFYREALADSPAGSLSAGPPAEKCESPQK